MCYNACDTPAVASAPAEDDRVVRFAVAQHGVGTRRHAFLLRGTGRRATRPVIFAGQSQGEEAPLRDLNRAPRTYEMMTILHPDVSEEELQPALDRVSGYITTFGGEVTETLRDSPWGRRRLAYPIRFGGRDLRDGYYTVFHFSLAPAQIVEMERELKLNTQVIRYLVTSYEEKPLDPKEIEQREIDAEEAAAQAYAAAQAAERAAEAQAAQAYAAAQASAATAASETAAAADETAATEGAADSAAGDIAAADDVAAAAEGADVAAGDAATEAAAAEAVADAAAEDAAESGENAEDGSAGAQA